MNLLEVHPHGRSPVPRVASRWTPDGARSRLRAPLGLLLFLLLLPCLLLLARLQQLLQLLDLPLKSSASLLVLPVVAFCRSCHRGHAFLSSPLALCLSAVTGRNLGISSS